MKSNKWSHQQKSVFKQIIPVVIIILPALVFGFLDKTTAMGLSIIAGSITIAFLNIDKIKFNKEGEFVEENKKAIDEAYETIHNLKEISVPLIVSTLNTIIYSGRYGELGINKRHDLKDDIEAVIDDLGINDKKVEVILEDFYKISTRDLFQYFTNEFLKGKSNYNELSEKLNALCDWNGTSYPSKDDILKTLVVTENDLNELEIGKLKDYVYYKQNRKLRRNIS